MAKRQANTEAWVQTPETDDVPNQLQNKKPAIDQKKETSVKICARFIIPSKLAGQLIGKKGTHVNVLRDIYGVQIAIPDSATAERLCRIISKDLECLVECIRDIVVKLGPDVCNMNNRLTEGQTEIRLLVNKNHCGGVIGAKGARIKELRESSGAVINMHGECCPGSTDRILQVSGEPYAVVEVLGKVLGHIQTLEPASETSRYEPGVASNTTGVHYGGIKGDGTSHPNSRDHMHHRAYHNRYDMMNPYMAAMSPHAMYANNPYYAYQYPYGPYPPMPYQNPYMSMHPPAYQYPDNTYKALESQKRNSNVTSPRQMGPQGDQTKRAGFGHGTR